MATLFVPTVCSAQQYRIVATSFENQIPFEEISIQEVVASETAFREEIEETKRKSHVGAILEVSPDKNGRNCVGYVKSKRDLPRPLLSLENKKAIINSFEPTVGAVAITEESWYGHLSLVVEITEDTIVVEEGNYIGGYRTVRVISKDLPVGYYL